MLLLHFDAIDQFYNASKNAKKLIKRFLHISLYKMHAEPSFSLSIFYYKPYKQYNVF